MLLRFALLTLAVYYVELQNFCLLMFIVICSKFATALFFLMFGLINNLMYTACIVYKI